MADLEGRLKDEVLRAALTISRGLGYRPPGDGRLQAARGTAA
jgi:hypothetical protein